MFRPILEQMIFLFAFILIGFILRKGKFVPDNAATVLSKLENTLFVPALVMGTFIQKCTVNNLKSNWQLLLLGFLLGVILVVISFGVAKLCFKEKFLQNITTYSVAFSNFGFMGNAIMQSVFGEEMFFCYIMFTLPFWVMIYLWGAPVLLIGNDGQNKGFFSRFKAFLNPMFVSLLIGAVIGVSGLGAHIPKVISNPVSGKGILDVAGACMSPLAMLLTGITIGQINLIALIKKWRLYVVSFIKLLIYPLAFILVFMFVPQRGVIDATFLTCAMNVMCMPTGLNAIVIPAAYGKDTSDAAGMTLITHALSLATIPLMFMLFQNLVL